MSTTATTTATAPVCWCGAPAEYRNPTTDAADAHDACAAHVKDGYYPLAPLAPGDRVTRNRDGATGTVETVTDWNSDTGNYAIGVRLDTDGEVWSGTEAAWTLAPAPAPEPARPTGADLADLMREALLAAQTAGWERAKYVHGGTTDDTTARDAATAAADAAAVAMWRAFYDRDAR